MRQARKSEIHPPTLHPPAAHYQHSGVRRRSPKTNSWLAFKRKAYLYMRKRSVSLFALTNGRCATSFYTKTNDLKDKIHRRFRPKNAKTTIASRRFPISAAAVVPIFGRHSIKSQEPFGARGQLATQLSRRSAQRKASNKLTSCPASASKKTWIVPEGTPVAPHSGPQHVVAKPPWRPHHQNMT